MNPVLKSALHQTKFGTDGKASKVVHIVYVVGTFGPFDADIPDGPNWNAEAQVVMRAQAANLQSLGAQP